MIINQLKRFQLYKSQNLHEKFELINKKNINLNFSFYTALLNLREMKLVALNGFIPGLIFFLFSGFLSYGQKAPSEKIQDGLIEELTIHPDRSFLVVFKKQSTNSSLNLKGFTKLEKATRVYENLKNIQNKDQREVIDFLKEHMASFQTFLIVNAIKVEGNASLIPALASFDNVASISGDPYIKIEPIQKTELNYTRDPGEPEWGIQMIGADKVWDLGYRGEGIVIAGQDTGYDWDQPTLKDKYKGFDGTNADHNYNWHDAIHELNPLNGDTINDPLQNPCGLNSLIPCDDHGHGTHTMGTMVGEDEENKIGVAPDAKWIACRNMDRGYGSPSTYLECFEFFLAPTDLNGENPDISKAPHVINNSWLCPELEGCNSDNWNLLAAAVENLRAAGIFVVASAGNNGSSGCGSINAPPAMFDGSFAVGASASNDSIAGFSSRGLVVADSSYRMKPNVVAPGVQVRSVLPDTTFASWNGTSMAGPHVAGAVALIISANPLLAGNVDLIEYILEKTAVPKTSDEDCFNASGTDIPNPVYGFGRIDAFEAVQMALTISQIEENTLPELSFYPNPATSNVMLHIENMSGNYELLLFDVSGRLVHAEMLNLQHSIELKALNVTQFSSGLYFCTLVSNEKFITRKLVKL